MVLASASSRTTLGACLSVPLACCRCLAEAAACLSDPEACLSDPDACLSNPAACLSDPEAYLSDPEACLSSGLPLSDLADELARDPGADLSLSDSAAAACLCGCLLPAEAAGGLPLGTFLSDAESALESEAIAL